MSKGAWQTRLELIAVAMAAVVCLLFVATLRDVSGRALWLPQSDGPALPESVGDRDARLLVTVVDSAGVEAEGVLVRAFAIIGDQAFRAGRVTTGADGRARMERLPRGECWLIAERDGLARRSTRLVLEEGERRLSLKLEDAESFEVVVVDPLQRPIRNVEVTLHASDPLPFRTHTDQRGLARFHGLPAPAYAVDVVAAGFDNKFLPRLRLEDSPVFVRLTRQGGLEISVLKPDGTPAVGAEVLVAGSSLWPARSAEANAVGRVIISGLPRGFYDIRAELGDLVSDAETGVMLAQGEVKELELTLTGGNYVKVTVTDGEADDAAVIAGADVALAEGGISSFPRYGRTGEDGKVVLGPILGDDAVVSARADGFVARSAVALEEGQYEVRVALLRGGSLVGEVVDERDYPIDGAQLEVVGVDIDGMPIVESSMIAGFREDHFAFALPGATPLVPAGELGVMPIIPDIPHHIRGELVVSRSQRTAAPWVSRGDGSFTIRPVTPGRVRVVARHPNYIEAVSEPVNLGVGGKAEVRLVMRVGGILEGRVIENDRTPVGGARIEVASAAGALERVTFSADDGTFALAALPEQVILSVARPEALEHVVERLTVDVPPDERRDIEIVLRQPRDPITVHVIDDRGYPLDRVEVRATSIDPAVPLRKTMFTDDSGNVELLDARSLSLRFVARRRGHAPVVSQVDSAPALVELTMDPALNAIGVVETRFALVVDAELTLLTPTGARHARSNEQGAFRFRDLAPTPARLLVVALGHVPRELPVTIEGDSQRDVDLGTIELIEGGSIKGRVVDEDGDPIAGARVAAGRVPTYLPLGPLPLGVASTGRDGRFLLPDLPPGATSIEAYKVGYGRDGADARVRAGDVAEGLVIELIEDPDVDITKVRSQASLAVTLSETSLGKGRVVVFEHVPLGGEAQRAGILGGDRFVSYNGNPIRSLEHARRSLNGPLSQDFVVELERPPSMRWRVRVRRERLRR